MAHDLRYAIRILIKSPAFTIAALVALTLGIGATTAMFSAVNAVLLRPLPFPDASRIFVIRETRPQAGFERTVVSEGEFLDWARDQASLEHAAIVGTPGLAIRLGDAPERIPALRVPADFFQLFGVVPATGRVFTREAEQPGHGDVILISYDLWQRRLGGAADVVGRGTSVESRPATIIGVLPKGFTFGGRVDAVVPMTLGPEQAAEFSSHSFDLYARLAPGVTREQATADLLRRVVASQGAMPHATGVTLVPMQDEVIGESRTPMLILFAAVGFVLLIACANIANLLLARAASRQKELAVRTALGASRARVLRQLITESLLLSSAGGVLGALLALWLSDLLARAAVDAIPRAMEIGIDGRALGFALAVSALSGLLFGVAPAWHAARSDVNAALKQESRGGSAAGRTRALAIFAIAEIALALVLLVGAGLLLTSFRNLRHVDPGFNPSRVMTSPARIPEGKYPTPDSQRAFFRRAVADLAGVPGVTAAAAVNALPLSGDNSSGAMTPEGWPAPPPGQRESADRRAITPDYFAAMDIRLLQGRSFSGADDERGEQVVIVSRALAAHYWPGANPIGKRLKLARYASPAPWITIVGVVADVRHGSLAQASRQVVYYPHAQLPEPGMVIVVRSAGAPGLVTAGIRGVLSRLEPDLPLDGLEPMTEVVRSSLLDEELESGLLGAFALCAVALAAAGIYGVMAYAISQRLQEFGIRLALGATGRDIVRLVAGYGLRLAAAGITIGLAGAWLASSALAGLLYGVRATDPLVFSGTAALLAAIALIACLVPTRRALRVSPIAALRGD
ncbi:MAG: ABC transporter permease [Acidobacteriota bacterium]